MSDDPGLLANDDIDALLNEAENDASAATAVVDGDVPSSNDGTADDDALLSSGDIDTLVAQADDAPEEPVRVTNPENGEYLSATEVQVLAGPAPQAEEAGPASAGQSPPRTSPRDILKRSESASGEQPEPVQSSSERSVFESGNEGIEFDEREIQDEDAPSLEDTPSIEEDETSTETRSDYPAEEAGAWSVFPASCRAAVARAEDAAARLVIRLGAPWAGFGPTGRAVTTCLSLATLAMAILTWIAGALR